MRGRDVRTVLGAVLGGGLGAGAWWVLDRTGTVVPVALAIAVGAVLGLGLALIRDLATELFVTVPGDAEAEGEPEGPDPVLSPWERRLGAATRDNRIYLATVQPALHDLARTRLRLHRGLDLDLLLRDPARADHELGAELCHWLTIRDHDATPPTSRQLSTLLTTVAAL